MNWLEEVVGRRQVSSSPYIPASRVAFGGMSKAIDWLLAYSRQCQAHFKMRLAWSTLYSSPAANGGLRFVHEDQAKASVQRLKCPAKLGWRQWVESGRYIYQPSVSSVGRFPITIRGTVVKS